ncbi:MAG: ribonuclease HII [Deltaproteobacteria bacterium]|nr:ribonuclease HII [Deltaproteobacteria bacterium]
MTLSLGDLQKRFRSAQSQAALTELQELLASDTRTGAVALVGRCAKRLQKLEAETRRMHKIFSLRADLVLKGAQWVAGVDEVGVGPLVGSVVAAAVILPDKPDLPGLNDSKKLTAAVRERLDQSIREQAIAFCIAEVDPPTIDRLNIYHAALEAMRRAVVGLSQSPDHVLVDARTIPGIEIPQTPIVHGDAEDGSIAAASVLAKVYRDEQMQQLHARYPEYGFDHNMGYPTQEHRDALERLGALPEHRRSFGPVAVARPRELS